MPVWPKSLLTLGAHVLTARTSLRLRRDGSAGRQRAAYRQLLAEAGRASYWRDRGVEPGLPYDTFRSRVPVSRYEELQPLIHRMQHGEPDLLWPGRCLFFCTSAGTTGEPKLLPVTTAMLHHVRVGCREALLYYLARTGHVGVLRGRQLVLAGSTALRPVEIGQGQHAFVGEWPAIAALHLPRWAEAHLFEPGVEIARVNEWQAKVEAIIARTATRDITLVAGLPTWTLAFAQYLRSRRTEAGQPITSLKALWPNLEVFVHTGLPAGPYAAELHAELGAGVAFHEVYAGAEGIFAAQDTNGSGELRVMSELGLFFEFIRLADYDETRLETTGQSACPLADVQPGVDYVVLVTTPAGLVRYCTGDVVRFSSTKPPRLACVGRTSASLAAFGEYVLERDVTAALSAVCERHRWNVVNFHVAPLFARDLTGQSRGRHEWWIELKPGTVETPTGPQMAVELDVALQQLSRSYAERRTSGRIDAPFVRLVMPGVFRHWMRFHRRVGGQSKVARCRSDRLLADELAQITKFAAD